jgi:hypothetical protein
MTVQSLRSRQRKGKIITAAGWFEDGTIRYVIYADAHPRTTFAPEPDAPPAPRMRGALAAEQKDLFG